MWKWKSTIIDLIKKMGMKYQTNKKCLSLKILIEAYVNNNYYQAFVFKLRM